MLEMSSAARKQRIFDGIKIPRTADGDKNPQVKTEARELAPASLYI